MPKIVIVGDLFPVPTNYEQFSRGNVEYLCGEKIIKLFKGADYRICNLEGALTDKPGLCEKTGPVLYAPTSTIAAYQKLGIDCCTLANNHITDAGATGVVDTIKTLDDAGIHHVGVGLNAGNVKSYHLFQVGKYNVCLYNVAETMYNAPSMSSPGAHLYDEYLVCKELEQLKRSCDYLLVVYHGGSEKFRYPSPQTKKRFHRIVDSGADVVLSQHTHCVGSEEEYRGGYLLYGQGNFLFRSFNNEFTNTGLIIELELEGGNMKVKKHLVNAVADTVKYDENQDFDGFNKRSLLISDEKRLQELFDEYCLQELPGYLGAFKGRSLFYKILRKFAPQIYRKCLFAGYSRHQMLLSLHALRSEQNREVAIRGMEVYLASVSNES